MRLLLVLLGAVLAGCAAPAAVTERSDFSDVNRRFADQVVAVALVDGRQLRATSLRAARDSTSFVDLATRGLVVVPTAEVASVRYFDRARNVRSGAVGGAAGGALGLGGFSFVIGRSLRDFHLGSPEPSEAEKTQQTILLTATGATVGAAVGAVAGAGLGALLPRRTAWRFAVAPPESDVAEHRRPDAPLADNAHPRGGGGD